MAPTQQMEGSGGNRESAEESVTLIRSEERAGEEGVGGEEGREGKRGEGGKEEDEAKRGEGEGGGRGGTKKLAEVITCFH